MIDDAADGSADHALGHVRITSTAKGETWSVTVAVGATLDEIETARAIAREIADRLDSR